MQRRMITLIKRKMVNRSRPTDDLDNEINISELRNNNYKGFFKLVEKCKHNGQKMKTFIRETLKKNQIEISDLKQ